MSRTNGHRWIKVLRWLCHLSQDGGLLFAELIPGLTIFDMVPVLLPLPLTLTLGLSGKSQWQWEWRSLHGSSFVAIDIDISIVQTIQMAMAMATKLEPSLLIRAI